MQKNKPHKLLLLFLALLLISLACRASSQDNFETFTAETVEAELAKASNLADAATATEIVIEEQDNPEPSADSTSTEVPTDTPVPTSTFTPTSTTIPTITNTPTDTGPCDVASFVTDVTVYDGEDFLVGEAFTKTWRLKNVGNCTWTTAYDLVFFDGDQMGGPVSQPLFPSGSVAPNQNVDISVDLIAPLAGGNYTGFWKLRNASNEVFELSSGNPFFVNIDVFEPTATPDFPILIPIIPPIILIGPDFSTSYGGTSSCFLWTKKVSARVVNTGGMTIESVEFTVEAPIGNVIDHSIQNFPFYNGAAVGWPDCTNPGSDSLALGDTGWVYGSFVNQPLPGLPGQITIKVCTLDDLGGFCKEKTINFIW